MSVNAARPHRRVVAIVVVFVVTLGVWGREIVGRTWHVAHTRGRDLHGYRALLALGDPALGPTDLLWLGDSTIVSTPVRTSYAGSIADDLALGRGVRTAVAACDGLDAFGYDALLPRLLARRPRVVVLVANFRLFAGRGNWSYADVLGAAPSKELPRQLALPYEHRGVSAARLVLARTLRWPAALDGMLWAAGMRHLAEHARAWEALGPRHPDDRRWSRLRQYARATLRRYAPPRGRDDPSVRMIGAAVERSARGGARSVVIVAPIPVERLRSRGHYDDGVYARAVAVLRDAVEARGGTVLDLHAALRRDQFRDIQGHLTAEGDQAMQRLATPAVLEALGS